MIFPWPLATDQEHCYDAEGIPVSCEASGQDAEGKSNGTHDDQRYRLDGDRVFDTVTGLHWCRNANRFDFPFTWPEALDLAAEMNRSETYGRRDWRLPSRRELFSLVSHQHINPALPRPHPFRSVFSGYYWTATTCARLPGQAWYVHLGGARVYRGMKHGAYLVWPVAGPRHDPPGTKNRFRTNERTVKDLWTGLYWAETKSATPCDWQAALRRIEALNEHQHQGISHWRLPNIRELESLVDPSRHSPALADGHPFKDIQPGYWSSTTSVYEPRYAWVLYPQDGAVGVGFKPEPTFSTWAVSLG
jgi:hypothetical protein